MSARDRAQAAFAARFDHPPEGIVFAPGRVNLIGEHVDYNDGLVLPMPISQGTWVAWRAAEGTRIDVVAADLDEAVDSFEPDVAVPHHPVDWRSYVRGMAGEMARRGLPVVATQIAIAGSIPRGAGLSSSAALCVATGRALAAAAGGAVPSARQLALAAQAAEHGWAGVHCGIMDQLAIAAGTPREAVLIDCRSVTTQAVPLPPEWAVMIVQSGVRRGLVDGQYNARRADCSAAVRALGLSSLRDASIKQIEQAGLEPTIARRARHVISEITRTEATVAAIAARDLQAIGNIFGASQASMRDDFDITVPAVDALVALLANAIGPHGGARMTGGGFGGAVVGVLPAEQVDAVTAAIGRTYRPPDGSRPQIMVEQMGSTAAGGWQ